MSWAVGPCLGDGQECPCSLLVEGVRKIRQPLRVPDFEDWDLGAKSLFAESEAEEVVDGDGITKLFSFGF